MTGTIQACSPCVNYVLVGQTVPACTGITFGNYGGGVPSFIPALGVGTAVDISNGSEWFYYNGSWH